MDEKTNALNQITEENVHSKLELLSDDEKRILFEALNTEIWKNKDLGPVKESKETLVKSLEFEDDTFKIDSTWRKEISIKDDSIFNMVPPFSLISRFTDVFSDKNFKIKMNEKWDVIECLNWSKKWEQFFLTYEAFIRELTKTKNCNQEEAESKYLMTIDEFSQKMEDKPYSSEEYKKFFNEQIKTHLVGCRDPSSKEFCDVDSHSFIRLAGGNGAGFNDSRWFYFDKDFYGSNGLSGRLLKN